MARMLGLLFLLCVSLHLGYVAAAVDPEGDMTTPEIVAHWGYPSEEHLVTTADGYILKVHRIPHGKNESAQGAQARPVIFLQHGLLGSSADWVLNMPWQSAGFVFADAGFDVWMGNFRGNTYCREHVHYTVEQKEFWDFTWDEMAAHDLPAMINYILQHSSQQQLYYVGHSMGTMTAFAAFSSNQTLGEKVSKFFALGPVATVGHIGGLLRLIEPIAPEVDYFMELFGDYEFLPSTPIMHWLAKHLCGLWYLDPICENIMFLIAGHDTHQWNQTRLAVYMEHTPAGTSTKNILHFAQQVGSNKFQAFDWGSALKNWKHYAQKTPPIYNATDFNVEAYLFGGTPDILADTADVAWLVTQLPNLKENNILPTFNHLDFLWGLDALAEVYKPILDIIQKDRQQ